MRKKYPAMIRDRRLLHRVVLWVLLLPAVAGGIPATAAGPAAAQNPFGLDPKGAPAKPGAAPTAPETRSPRFRPPAAFQRFVATVARWQRRLNDQVARQVAAYKARGAIAPVLAILLLSFLYGLFHAAGPGHGKFVVAAYFLANRARPRDGVLMSGLIALTQALVAIGLVGIFALALDTGTLEMIDNATWVELASYALIVLLGLWMFWGGIVGRGCSHTHGPGGHRDREHGHEHGASGPAEPGRRAMVTAAVAAGLRPCTGAVIVLLFTLANGIFAIGVLGALVMALGVAITVSAIGLAAIYARRGAARAAGASPALARYGNLAHRAAGLAGGGAIVLIGAVLALAAAERLGLLV
ncbi:MAG: hypothetical protein OXH59_07305 [Rhodospirillaceae bacterium]|nr:hypothetical protein [Rhodospirillaceae bacterium]